MSERERARLEGSLELLGEFREFLGNYRSKLPRKLRGGFQPE